MKSISFVNFAPECKELSLGGWTTVDKFKSKNKVVDHNGIKYEIVTKATKKTSLFKRIACIVISILIVPLCFKSIRQIVFKGKQNQHIAVPHCEAAKRKKMDDLMDSTWNPKAAPVAKALGEKKMWKNAEKAVKEHSNKKGYAFVSEKSIINASSNSILSILEGAINFINEKLTGTISKITFDPHLPNALPSLNSILRAPMYQLNLSSSNAAAKGLHRDTMEGAHFSTEISQGLLSGVFDGHGGKKIAEFASKAFQFRFEKTLNDADENVHAAFETLFSEIQHEVAKCEPLYNMGSTAVVSFIDKETSIIYTATLGNSEANIYRKINNRMKSIPLSCVRDWSSPKDAARAARVLDDPSIATEWPKHKGKPRFPSPTEGVNVARAFGDIKVGHLDTGSGMIHKPKITMNKLEVDDVVILACDGLKDYVPENLIAQKIADNYHGYDLAKKLVDYAIDPKGADAHDNVTVVAIQAMHPTASCFRS